jgi:hypothetical protein
MTTYPVSAMQKYPPPFILFSNTMVSLDKSYNSTTLEESSNSHRGSVINTLTSTPRNSRTNIDVLTGSLHNNRMDDMSPGLEPISPAMARLQKRTYSPMATVIWSPKKTTPSQKKGRTSATKSKSPNTTSNITNKQTSLHFSFMSMLYKQKINDMKQATAHPGDSDLQLKSINATQYNNLFVLTKRLGKANWFGWKDQFCLINSTEYARNIFSKTDDARECSTLTKVFKIKNANKGAVAYMICWKNSISSECFFCLKKIIIQQILLHIW